MLTPEELKQIRRLTLQAGRRVDSLFAGGYRSAVKGRGMEFEEVRPYVHGDDVRHIDWNVTARTLVTHVKEYREERELTLVLAVDVSGSMDFGSGGADGETDKRRQLARIGGALAYAATRNNDRVGLMVFSDHVERYVPPRKSRGHAWRVIREVYGHQAAGRATDIRQAVETLGRVLRRRAVICIVSDFMGGRSWVQPLGALAAKHQVHTFVVHDPREGRGGSDAGRAGIAPRGWLVGIEDAETGERGWFDSSRLRSRRDLDELLRTLGRAGAAATAVGTDQDPFRALELHFQRVGARR